MPNTEMWCDRYDASVWVGRSGLTERSSRFFVNKLMKQDNENLYNGSSLSASMIAKKSLLPNSASGVYTLISLFKEDVRPSDSFSAFTMSTDLAFVLFNEFSNSWSWQSRTGNETNLISPGISSANYIHLILQNISLSVGQVLQKCFANLFQVNLQRLELLQQFGLSFLELRFLMRKSCRQKLTWKTYAEN